MKSAMDFIDEIQLSGVVVIGREYIDGLLSGSTIESPKEQVVAIFQQGRSYGIYVYKDVNSFNSEMFFIDLGKLGFNENQSLRIYNNINPKPFNELLYFGGRD